jgi:ribosomal protein L18
MAEKDFVVKNGLVVNTNLIVADGDLNRVGINNSSPDSTLTVTGSANVSGNVVLGANLTVTGSSISSQVLVGSNVVVNSTTMSVGNSTVNSTQTSTLVRIANSTTSSNLTSVDLKIGTAVVNTISLSVGANASINASAIKVGNTIVNSTVFTLGNATVNTSINSTAIILGGTQTLNTTAFVGTSNNSTNFAGQSQSFYTNATNITSGTLPSARISGAYTNISAVGNLSSIIVTGNTSLTNLVSITSNSTVNSFTVASNTIVNIDSGLLYVDPVNNRIGINNATPDAALTVTGSANVSGDLAVLGNLIITGNTVSQGTQEFTGALTPSSNSINLGNSTNRWILNANTGDFSGNVLMRASLSVGNSTTNSVVDGSSITIGNSSVNVSINTTAFSGIANNANNLNGQPASFYTNATNIGAGTLNNARLNVANTSQAGIVQLVDSVTDTSIVLAATANSVKLSYDAAIAANTRAASAQTAAATAYTNAVSYTSTFASNATNITSGTLNAARLPTGNVTTIGGLQIVDSVANVSAGVAAAANSVKVTYDAAIAANTRAASAQTAAAAAYTNATTFATSGDNTTYSNATAFSSNATNITSGTLNAARLPTGNVTTIGGLQIVDSVTNVSSSVAAAANSAKRSYDTAIAANTRAASAQTAAAAAYTNATAFSSNASNISTGTLPSARISGAYTGISQVGTLSGVVVTGDSNFDSGVLFVDGTNNRVGVNTTTPSVSLVIASNDAILVPIGNTLQRPSSAANGMFRYNIEIATFEGYSNGSWGTIAGGAGGYYKGNLGAQGNTNNKANLFRINSNTQSNNITISAGENALTVGPIVISPGFNLTIEEGGRAVII